MKAGRKDMSGKGRRDEMAWQMEDYNGRKVVLCEDTSPDFSTLITAEVRKGCLILKGRDRGPSMLAFLGVDLYEYSYSFDEENTKRLFEALGADQGDVLAAIQVRFGGMSACNRLTRYAESLGIQSSFDALGEGN
jgi:hypothetical protein